MNATRQADKTFSIVADIKAIDGTIHRFVNVAPDVDAYYVKVRALIDNPTDRDLENEKESLVKSRSVIDEQINEVDSLISAREAKP